MFSVKILLTRLPSQNNYVCRQNKLKSSLDYVRPQNAFSLSEESSHSEPEARSLETALRHL